MLWIVCAVVVVVAVAALAAVLLPLRLRVSVQGRGEPDGGWLLAGGVQLGPLALSALAGRGIDSTSQLHVWGRQLWRFQPGLEPKKKKRPKPPRKKRPLRKRYQQLSRWLEPTDVAAFILGEHKRIRLDEAQVELSYSFVDVARTGVLCGAFSVLGGVLPPRVTLRQKPSWESVDRVQAELDGVIKLWPGRVLVDVMTFLLANVKLRKPRAQRSLPASGSNET